MFYIEYFRDMELSDEEIALVIFIFKKKKVHKRKIPKRYREALARIIERKLVQTASDNSLRFNYSFEFYDEITDPIILFELQSPYQEIELCKAQNDSIFLKLNGIIQFHTSEQKRSHEMMVAVPLTFSENLNNILILGGGDGLAAREALEFNPEQVTVVELDPKMIEMTRTVPEMRDLCNDAFNNPKVQVIAGDAIEFLLQSQEQYDVIIDDCALETTTQPIPIGGRKYQTYQKQLYRKLQPGGVASFMENEDLWEIIPSKKVEDIEKILQLLPEINLSRLEEYFKEEILFFNQKKFEYVRYKYMESQFLGPELYLYLSNNPFSKKRNPPKTCKFMQEFQFD